MTIISFILGGVYTIAMLVVGFLAGYYYRNNKLPQIKTMDNLVDAFANKFSKKDEAGPVKSITKVEREAEKTKGFTDRIKELTTD